MGAMRLKIVRIHLLRQPGYETADETAKLSLPMSTLLVGTYDNNVGASIARPLLCLGRQSVTVIPQYNFAPLSVAHCLHGSGLRGSCQAQPD